MDSKEVDYRDRMISCYPIHPEIFDRLYIEWATLEHFQRTRGVLRLMAAVIHELWMANDASAMIMSDMLPIMQSDIMLSKYDTVLIIDAKYYSHTTQMQYDMHTLHSGNLYQIFTYVKNKDTEFGDQPHKVFGMLLYAATDEAIQPDNTYQMSGNKISVKTLDLNRDFSEIAAQLNAIVEDHFGKNYANAK